MTPCVVPRVNGEIRYFTYLWQHTRHLICIYKYTDIYLTPRCSPYSTLANRASHHPPLGAPPLDLTAPSTEPKPYILLSPRVLTQSAGHIRRRVGTAPDGTASDPAPRRPPVKRLAVLPSSTSPSSALLSACSRMKRAGECRLSDSRTTTRS
jgi:hypothetical protein